jgi:hypothetical protein
LYCCCTAGAFFVGSEITYHSYAEFGLESFDCYLSIGMWWQAQELITEIVSLQKEVSHLEQHVLSLYRKVFDQRLSTDQYGTDLHSSEAQEPSILISQSSYHVSRFRAEQLRQTQLPPSSPQHRHPGSAAMQGFRRPHSSIGAGQVKTQHRSLLNDSFYCVDKEPKAGGEPQGSTASPVSSDLSSNL